jgi:hypothetical protein
MDSDRTRWIGVGIAGGAALAAYHLVIRPWHLRLGSTDAEVARAMPGDEAVLAPQVVTTRAVTIRASPAQIWPWLAQLGYQRGGLYSYDRLDRLFGILDRPSAAQVLPQFQRLAVGDVIPMGSGPSWPVTVLEPEQALVVEPVAGQVSWCFGLYPVDAQATRLVSRVRVGLGWGPLLRLLAPAVDLPWLVMERKMLVGIKLRAESLAASRPTGARAGSPAQGAMPTQATKLAMR